MKNLQLTLCLLVKDWRLSLWSQEKKDRNIFSYHLYSDYTGDSSHCRQVKKKEKERYWDCKEVKTDFYYRPNVHLCRNKLLFLNIGTEQLGIEMENNIIYHIKNVKYFGMHLIKYVWDLYTENYKILLREVKADLNKSRDRLYIHGLENSILLRCQFIPNWSIDLI